LENYLGKGLKADSTSETQSLPPAPTETAQNCTDPEEDNAKTTQSSSKNG